MVLKKQTLAIEHIYVPVKRRQTLDLQKVEALAESMAGRAHSRAT
jgi:sulfiredoxin